MTKKQLELFASDTTWIHILRPMLQSGEAGDMGGTTYLIYSVIKSHTDLGTGDAIPSDRRIAQCAKVSEDTVRRSRLWLLEHGYLEKIDRPGKNNLYRIKERFPCLDAQGNKGYAVVDYIGTKFDKMTKRMSEGDFSGVHVTINVQVAGDNASQAIINLGQEVSDPNLRAELARLLSTVGINAI